MKFQLMWRHSLCSVQIDHWHEEPKRQEKRDHNQPYEELPQHPTSSLANRRMPGSDRGNFGLNLFLISFKLWKYSVWRTEKKCLQIKPVARRCIAYKYMSTCTDRSGHVDLRAFTWTEAYTVVNFQKKRYYMPIHAADRTHDLSRGHQKPSAAG